MEFLLFSLLPPALGVVVLLLAYVVIRRAVRDGMLDATALDRELAAERRTRVETSGGAPLPREEPQ